MMLKNILVAMALAGVSMQATATLSSMEDPGGMRLRRSLHGINPYDYRPPAYTSKKTVVNSAVCTSSASSAAFAGAQSAYVSAGMF
jgi:hypothetical protein